MTDTVRIDIPLDDWTDVTSGGNNGLITNNSNNPVRIREAGSVKPTIIEDIGHVLNPKDDFYYNLVGGQRIWAQAVNTPVKLIVTSGSGVSKSGSFTKDFLLNVNMGNVPGHKLIHKFGSNDSISTTAQDIWSIGGLIPWMVAAEKFSVVSSDTTNDISGGTGAHSVLIKGLDASFNEIEETVALASTPVNTVASFIRMQTCEVVSSGTYTGSNLGTITMTGVTSGNAHGGIKPSQGRSSQAQYTIPAGKTGYVVRVSISMDAGKAVNINMHRREGADIVVAPFKSHQHTHHWDGLDTPVNQRFFANMVFKEKTDVWFDGKVTTGSASIDVDYDLLIVDN